MATVENAKNSWDEIWDREGLETWRRYPSIFGRIQFICQHLEGIQQKTILDVGCGVGILLNQLKQSLNCQVYGVDLSESAIRQLNQQGIPGELIDLEDQGFILPKANILCATEVVEHLTDKQFHRFLSFTPQYETCFISTPNYCLGPEEESQHFRKLSVIEFLNILRQYRDDWRVECYEHYMMGIAGYPVKKDFKLSFTMPVKNEEKDIERVLKSFRGVADEIVIGLDDKTNDKTEEIVRRYAEKVFFFTWENDFSKARNLCIDRCEGDWIFMSEGHESLETGVEALLRLGPNDVPSYVKVIDVRRTSREYVWYFPWLFRNHPSLRFEHPVHNQLTGYEDHENPKAEQISTWHERAVSKSIERALQRKGMNAIELLNRIHKNKRDLTPMFYLAGEYTDRRTDYGYRKAVYWYRQFITLCKPGHPLRYQSRIALGRLLVSMAKSLAKIDPDLHAKEIADYINEARVILSEASNDDPLRVEHWLFLGDLCQDVGQLDYAMRFYEYAATGIGRIPTSALFINKDCYSFLPAQKLASMYANLGFWREALAWAKKVEALLPEWAPPEAIEEVHQNVLLAEEKLKENF